VLSSTAPGQRLATRNIASTGHEDEPGAGRHKCDDSGVSNPPQVTDNQAESRLEADAGGHRAELLYRRNGNRFVLIHTEVPVEAEGHGIGGALVTAAIDRAARDGMTVVPLCPFARGWLERHPDVANRAAIDWG
jgi:uncharacterized protein